MNDRCLFAQFVETALPRECFVAGLMHVYVDESGTHDGARVMGLAGYIFEASQAARFSRDWQKCLQKIGIPFAHMTDCANGNGVYTALSLDERVQSERLLIESIKRRSKVGIATLVDPSIYEEVCGSDPKTPSAYSFCVLAFVSAATRWAEKMSFKGRFAYFFEGGHRFQAQANASINDLPRSKSPARDFYLSHSFFDKKDAPPLQAADMLAWQACHYFERASRSHQKERKDFRALIRKQDYFNFYRRDDLLKIRPTLDASAEAPDALANPLGDREA